MKVCGFGIARETLRFGYPLEASLRSLLPLVDELVLNVGQGDDGTWEMVRSLNEPKIKAFQSTWDLSSRRGGRLLTDETNRALERCKGDWGVYLQADEVLHENDYATIRRALDTYLRGQIEALTFRYHHFYGSFQTVQDHPHRWYRAAIRAVKLGIGAASRGDAMDFGARRNGRIEHLRHADSGACVYHYGWSRPPHVMLEKQRNFHRLYYDDEWVAREYGDRKPEQMYWDLGHLQFFRGTHPLVMQSTVARQTWTFQHGIEHQPPEWLRHRYALTMRYGRAGFHRVTTAARKMARALQLLRPLSL